MSNGFIKVQRLSNTIRVVMRQFNDGTYYISAQQYMPHCNYTWEVQPDGWRDTQTRFSTTLEGARREFDDLVRGEQRWVEQDRRVRQ